MTVAIATKPTVLDAASYIVSVLKPIPAGKLQNLVYYTQVWSLVRDEAPIFGNKILTHNGGINIPELYEKTFGKGIFKVENIEGNKDIFNNVQKNTLDEVIRYYGRRKIQWLVDLVHIEMEQIFGDRTKAQEGREISLASMMEYYIAVDDN